MPLLLAQTGIVHEVQGARQRTFVIPAVIDAARAIFVRKLAWLDEVAASGLNGVQAENPTHFFDGPLSHERRFRPACAAIRSGWTGCRQHAQAFSVIRLDAVGTG